MNILILILILMNERCLIHSFSISRIVSIQSFILRRHTVLFVLTIHVLRSLVGIAASFS